MKHKSNTRLSDYGDRTFNSPDEVEEAFYSAFAKCDAKAMEPVWAEGKVVCIHPGSQAIYGYNNVIRSWSHIFINSSLPKIIFNVVNSSVNDSLAVHLVEEHIATGKDSEIVVLATNVYQLFDEGWLMIEHHGSVIRSQLEGRTVQ